MLKVRIKDELFTDAEMKQLFSLDDEELQKVRGGETLIFPVNFHRQVPEQFYVYVSDANIIGLQPDHVDVVEEPDEETIEESN